MKMTESELKNKLDELLALPAETEWVEFKKAERNIDFRKLGKYFSALSNEANLKNQSCAWLVFGIEDATRKIVGTHYRPTRPELDSLKSEIANKTTSRITFTEIHELILPEGRAILFQIPPAPRGIPVAWDGHYYGREDEDLSPLNIQELEQIRHQTKDDWSAHICEGASLDDLESLAIQKARSNYKEKFPAKSKEVDGWDDITFFNKIKITIQGKITRTAIILLGKEESEHFISPSVTKITWTLRDEKNQERDYEHFSCPMLLNTDKVFQKIRNLKYRYLPNKTLFPIEIDTYEPYVIREALHNCIAHQDYELRGRINVVEYPDKIVFTNVGSFIPETVEKVIEQDAPPEHYRNAFLANAMVNLNMIDTAGGGIKKMFTIQKERFFPLPDFDLSDPQKVKVIISGKVIDENYTRLLINKTDLDLKTVILLDRVQKKFPLKDSEVKMLRTMRLIEGRKPNLFVSARIAQITDQKIQYTRFKAFDKKYYQDMIKNFITQHGQATRKEIDGLIIEKLPDYLKSDQKKIMVNNLLNEMSNKLGVIKNKGSRTRPVWIFK